MTTATDSPFSVIFSRQLNRRRTIKASGQIYGVFLASGRAEHSDVKRAISFIDQQNTPLTVRFCHRQVVKIGIHRPVERLGFRNLIAGAQSCLSGGSDSNALGSPVFRSTMETEGNCLG